MKNSRQVKGTANQSSVTINTESVKQIFKHFQSFMEKQGEGRAVRKFTKTVLPHTSDRSVLLAITKCMPSSFASQLWNHLEFVRKLSFVWRGNSNELSPIPCYES